MAIFGPRFDQAAAQSFARSFDPIRYQEFEMKKDEHQTKLDQLQTDKEILEAIQKGQNAFQKSAEDKDAGYNLLSELQNIAKIPNTIRKPALNAWVNSIEARVGEPLSPLLRDVLQKGDPQELEMILDNVVMAASENPEFGQEGLLEILKSDRKVGEILVPAAQGVQKDTGSEPGTKIKPDDAGGTPDPRNVAIKNRVKGKVDEAQLQVDYWTNVMTLATQKGGSEKVMSSITDRLEMAREDLRAAEEALQKIEGKIIDRQTSRADKIAEEKRAEEREKRKEGRKPGVERDVKETTDDAVFYTDKLEEVEEQLSDPNLPDEERARLERRKRIFEELIEKETAGPMSQTEGVNLRAQNEARQDMMDKKAALESFALKAINYDKLITQHESARTLTAELARWAVNFKADIMALAPNDSNIRSVRGAEIGSNKMISTVIGVNGDAITKTLHFDPNDWDPELWDTYLPGLAKSNAVAKSIAISMAFQIAFMRGQTGKALSDRDLALFMTEIGFNERDPSLIKAVIGNKVKELRQEFEISWQNSLMKDEPIPTYNVDLSVFDDERFSIDEKPKPGEVEKKKEGTKLEKGGKLKFGAKGVERE